MTSNLSTSWDARLRDGRTVHQVSAQLEELNAGLSRLRVIVDLPARLNQYTLWLINAENVLRANFSSFAVWEGLFTDRYWHLEHQSVPSHRSAQWLLSEIDMQGGRLVELRESLLAQAGAFQVEPGTVIAMPDTNIIVHFHALSNIPWTKVFRADSVAVVLPLLVLDELDVLSNRSSEVSQRARRRVRWLSSHREGASHPHRKTDLGEGMTLQILTDPPGHRRLPQNDDEIVARALYLRGLSGAPVTIVTSDLGMKFRAQNHELPSVTLGDEYRADRDET